MSKKQTITLRERGACALYVLTEGQAPLSQVELFKAANSASLKHTEGLAYPDSAASRWLNSAKIQKCIADFRRVLDDELEAAREEARQEVLSRDPDKETLSQRTTDYSDPRSRAALYNEIIDRSRNDPKTQLDAAKMFEQIQKDDRQAAATTQKQSRVYLPLQCHSCPLYQKERNKLNIEKNY